MRTMLHDVSFQRYRKDMVGERPKMSIEIVIDGKKVSGRADQTILEVAKEHGIYLSLIHI